MCSKTQKAPYAQPLTAMQHGCYPNSHASDCRSFGQLFHSTSCLTGAVQVHLLTLRSETHCTPCLLPISPLVSVKRICSHLQLAWPCAHLAAACCLTRGHMQLIPAPLPALQTRQAAGCLVRCSHPHWPAQLPGSAHTPAMPGCCPAAARGAGQEGTWCWAA